MGKINSSQKIITIFASVFGLSGIGMLLGSLASFTATQDFLKQAVPSVGTVVKLRLEDSDEDEDVTRMVYYPIVEFMTANGEKYQSKGSIGSYPASYQVGDSLSVLYHPDNPHRFEINSFWSLWFSSIVLMLLGGTFTAVGSFFVFLFLKLKKIDEVTPCPENFMNDFDEVDWLEPPLSFDEESIDFEEIYSLSPETIRSFFDK